MARGHYNNTKFILTYKLINMYIIVLGHECLHFALSFIYKLQT